MSLLSCLTALPRLKPLVEASALCCHSTVAVRATHLAFGYLGKDRRETVGAREHPLDIATLVASNMIKVENHWVWLAAIDARVREKVRPDNTALLVSRALVVLANSFAHLHTGQGSNLEPSVLETDA